MSTRELIKKQVETAGTQLEATFAGLTDEQASQKAHPQMLSPKEIAMHLTECYIATQKQAGGQEHEWGTYQAADTSWEGVQSAYRSEREKALEALMQLDEEKAAHLATDYMILHDAYHVGQMCTNRLALDPNWNAYSIYGM